MEFAGRVALITGAGTGIGEAIAERVLAGGASVGLLSRRLDSVQSVCRRIDPEGARTLALQADVCDPRAVEAAVKRVVDRFGTLDLAVNNAGVTGPAGVPVQDMGPGASIPLTEGTPHSSANEHDDALQRTPLCGRLNRNAIRA